MRAPRLTSRFTASFLRREIDDMCGISGVATLDGLDVSSLIERMTDTLRHRGPDDVGWWYSRDRRVWLGHRRLAILDLSPAGHQPMHSQDGDLCIVFNGEIYNFLDLRQDLTSKGYSFFSECDTEVLLAAYKEWGPSYLTRLNGMFAIAIYDFKRQSVFLSRDRAGEKPLFYSVLNNQLKFASELKAILADPEFYRRIDRSSLDCYLATGYIPGRQCILAGVQKLPPGHTLSYNLLNGEAKLRRYWDLPTLKTRTNNRQTDEEHLVDDLNSLLEDAVRRQMVADVPVGVLLSGGIDSSLVTAMAVRSSSHVKTFNVIFPGFRKYDESCHARLIANHFCTDHTELEGGNVEPELMVKLARQYDEPIIDSSMIPTFLICQLIRKHCKVALGGDGGDELFGGYHHYTRLLWSNKYFRLIPHDIRKLVARGARELLPTGFRGRNWLQAVGHDFTSGLPLVATHFDFNERLQLLKNYNESSPIRDAEGIFAGRIPELTDLLQRATRMDFENYLPEDILVKVDRASMLNSLEMRAPFLDYRIIEFAFNRVSSRLKAINGRRKILLKSLAALLLPPEFDLQRKQGFSVPLPGWLTGGPWRTFFEDVLLDSQCVFDKAAVAALFKGQDRGRGNSERLFGLVLLELWRREYKVAFD